MHCEGLLVVAATFGFASSAQARILLGSPGPAALSNGLVGYWPLDGAVTNWNTNTTADLSGQGNTGTLVSLGTTTAPVAGKIGQALRFDGVSSNISFAANVPLADCTSDNTIAVWFKTSASGTIVSLTNVQIPSEPGA